MQFADLFAGLMLPDAARDAFPLPENEPLPDYAAGVRQALGDNARLAEQKRQGGGLLGGFRNVLGDIGDALLVANNAEPMYRQRKQREKLAGALANYLGNIDPGLADIFAQDPKTGFGLWKMKNPAPPAIVAELKAAGIDPDSEEGREIIRQKVTGGTAPAFVRELQAFGFSPEEARAIARRRYTRPIVIGSPSTGYGVLDDGLGEGEGGGNLPTVSSQEEYDALPPGTPYLDSQGNRAVKGGATGGTSLLPFDRVMGALIKQESGGDGTAVSSAGALGSTQMLPATAKEMAAKVGLPFRPELLRSNAPQALAYQRKLGEAYLREGLEKTGNLRDALRYYHGGPDRKMWGPKTNAYASSVLATMGAR